jgi:hypothetical protein
MGSLLATLITFSVTFAEPGFVPIGGHDGVDVYLHKDPVVIELAAIGEFDAPPAQVQAALLDYGAHPKIIKHLAESKILAKSPGEMHVYQHLQLPVIKDRDYTLRVAWTEGMARGLGFTIDNTPGPAATKKAVRMTVLEGRWELTPIRDGQATRAVYHVKLDFAGSVPRWMVRGGAAKDIPNIYIGFRQAINDKHVGFPLSASRQ